jgi:outer membrane protein TolC
MWTGLPLAIPAQAQTAAPGATVEELLAIGRRLNPDIAAAGLEADAAAAKVQGADSLPDPTFTLFSDQNENRKGGLVPNRWGNLTYTVSQTFPLGGKRDLKKEIAGAEYRQAGSRRQAVEAELAARIKVAFADYYGATQAILVTREIQQVVQNLARASESRYTQNLGSQQDVLKAQVERATIEGELIRLESDRRRAQIRLNKLLNREAAAALAEPRILRPVPVAQGLQASDLVERARRTNPALALSAAQIEAADGNRRLVEKSWVPDLTAGIGVVQEQDRIFGYEATLMVNIPLRWGLRESQEREATMMAAAARSRRESTLLQLESDLGESVVVLGMLQKTASLLQQSTILQSRAAFQSGLRAFELGQGDILAVLDSHRRLRQAQLDLLRIQIEQQARLAEIERLIGEDL